MTLRKFATSGMFSRFARDRSGSVAVIAAFVLPLMVGAAALVGEYGSALLDKTENQRISDLAAYAGAKAYIDRITAGGTEAQAETAMRAAARRVAGLNGIPDAATVPVELVASPRNPSVQAVQVNILTQNPLLLAQIFGTGPTVGAAAEAFAEIGVIEPPEPEPPSGSGGCIVALNGSGSGLTLSGGASLSAVNCVVSSNNTVTVPCGTSIKTQTLTYNSASTPNQPCNGIKKQDGSTTQLVKTTTADPMIGNAGIAATQTRLATLSALTAPPAPSAPTLPTKPTGGLSIDFGYNDSSTKSQAVALGCTADKSGSTWALNCPSGTQASPRTYNIANITVGGGLHLDFVTSGNGTSTYNISGAISVDCCKVYKFGAGNYNFGGNFTNNSTVSFAGGSYNFHGNFQHSGPSTTFVGGPIKVAGNLWLLSSGTVVFPSTDISVGGEIKITGSVAATFGNGNVSARLGYLADGGVTVNFGTGSYRFGQGTTDCNWNAGKVSFCNKSGAKTLFTGSSDFRLSHGLFNNAIATFGTGSNNSFRLGGSSIGNALRIDGSAQTILGDATGNDSVFQMIGHLNGGGGGSCTIIGAAAQHDIYGNVTGEGAIWLGNGVYSIDGYFWMGANSGGSATCAGQTFSVRGDAVTLVINGRNVPSPTNGNYWGNCTNQSFCVGAGYNNIKLSAPTSGLYQNLVIIGPQSASNVSGATWKEGASSGLFSGVFYYPNGPIAMSGGSGASGGSACLQLVATQITLDGGTTATSECVMTAGTGNSPGGPVTPPPPSLPARPTLIQ